MFDCDDFSLHVFACVDWFQLVFDCVCLSCAGVGFSWFVLTCLGFWSLYFLHLVGLFLLTLDCVGLCWFVFACVGLCWFELNCIGWC